MKRKTKMNIKKILSVVLIVATLFGVVTLIRNCVGKAKDELDKVNPSFALGTLDENGQPTDSDLSMYSKKAIECAEYKVSVDFEAKLVYQLYFYDETGEFVSCTEETKTKSEGKLPDGATHMRIVVRSLDDYFNEDGILSWMERIKLENRLSVKVLTEAEVEAETTTPDVTTPDVE